jgi:hypothetical protein
MARECARIVSHQGTLAVRNLRSAKLYRKRLLCARDQYPSRAPDLGCVSNLRSGSDTAPPRVLRSASSTTSCPGRRASLTASACAGTVWPGAEYSMKETDTDAVYEALKSSCFRANGWWKSGVSQRFSRAEAIGPMPAGVAEPGHADARPGLESDAFADGLNAAHDFVARHNFGSGSSPSTTCRSVRQTPQASTRRRIWARPGIWSGRSSMASHSPARRKTMARMSARLAKIRARWRREIPLPAAAHCARRDRWMDLRRRAYRLPPVAAPSR